MRALVIILLVGGIALWPFVLLRRPWAMRVWERFKLVIVVYVLVVALAAIFSLIFRWDEIYG